MTTRFIRTEGAECILIDSAKHQVSTWLELKNGYHMHEVVVTLTEEQWEFIGVAFESPPVAEPSVGLPQWQEGHTRAYDRLSGAINHLEGAQPYRSMTVLDVLSMLREIRGENPVPSAGYQTMDEQERDRARILAIQAENQAKRMREGYWDRLINADLFDALAKALRARL